MDDIYSEIDTKFANYIISLIGPNEIENQRRDEKFKLLKSILESSFKESEIKLRLFNFGSFPLRTYLPESDMDVTLILEDAEGRVTNLSQEKQREYLIINKS